MSRHTPATLLGALLARLRTGASALWRWEARLKGVEFLGRCTLQGRPMFSVAPGSHIVIGDGVALQSAVRANPLGLAQPCTLRTLAQGARLVLGANAGLSGNALCAARSIEIGEDTLLGAGAMLMDTDFHALTAEGVWNDDCAVGVQPIIIGRGVFIGARAIILKGVTVGDRAIIGAGAVVTQNVPAHHVAVGNPARCFPQKDAPARSQTGA